MVREHGLSVRQACRAARLTRSAYYVPARPRQDRPVIGAIQDYIGQNPMHGFDKLYPVVRRQGFGKCRLYRVYKALGLNIKRRGKRRPAGADQGAAGRSCKAQRGLVGRLHVRCAVVGSALPDVQRPG